MNLEERRLRTQALYERRRRETQLQVELEQAQRLKAQLLAQENTEQRAADEARARRIEENERALEQLQLKRVVLSEQMLEEDRIRRDLWNDQALEQARLRKLALNAQAMDQGQNRRADGIDHDRRLQLYRAQMTRPPPRTHGLSPNFQQPPTGKPMAGLGARK